MRLFFWDFDDVNDIERQWCMFAVNILAFIFTTVALTKTARFHKICIFQLLPLSINTVATFILLTLKLFERGFEFDELGYLTQIFTYFLFCYTFAQMHIIVIGRRSNWNKKVCNIILGLFGIFILVLMILVLTRTIAKDCDGNIFAPSLASFITELVSFIPTAFYGIDILNKIIQKHKLERKDQQETNNSAFTPSSDQYVKERKKQIIIVVSAYASSLILRGSILFSTYELQDYFSCEKCDDIFIVTSDYAIGQFLLVLIEINQLIPHIVIPIALYVIPVQKINRASDVHLESTLIDNDDDHDEIHGDVVQRRISSSIRGMSTSMIKTISASSEKEQDNNN